MDKKLVKCSKISVNCVENNPIDIKCGGPKYLGFDFYVKEEEQNRMKKIICSSINEIGIPIINVIVTNNIYKDIENIWYKDIEIRNQIKKNSTYLYKNAISTCRTRKEI